MKINIQLETDLKKIETHLDIYVALGRYHLNDQYVLALRKRRDELRMAQTKRHAEAFAKTKSN